MNTIYKYPIEIVSIQTLELPVGAVIVHAGLDPQGTPCLWAKVDNKAPVEPRHIIVAGTGHCLTEYLLHVGSFVQNDYVWHVFIQHIPLKHS